MTDLIVKAAVRDTVDDCNVAADFYAERRAQANEWKTVSARDL
jgi:hypothetical protein